MMKHTYLNIIGAFVTLLVAFFVSATPLHSQTRKVMHRPYVDQRPFHYGFLAGMQFMDIEFSQNGYIDEEGNQWFADAPNYEPGFCVGILGEKRINKYLAVRFIPTMHFGTKNVHFRNQKETPNDEGAMAHEKQYQNMRATYFTVPIDLKYSAERFNNYRPYMMAGIAPAIDLTIKKGQNHLLQRFDCFLEVGLGCDFYAPWFKCIPELKFCYGLANIINHDRSDLTDVSKLIFSESVDKARSKMIVFTLYFE